MTTELLKKLGTVSADNLVAGTDPALRVGTGKLHTGDSGNDCFIFGQRGA